MTRKPTLGDLTAEARHAADRFALLRQKVYAGRGDAKRLEEARRASDGASARLQARKAADDLPDQESDG